MLSKLFFNGLLHVFERNLICFNFWLLIIKVVSAIKMTVDRFKITLGFPFSIDIVWPLVKFSGLVSGKHRYLPFTFTLYIFAVKDAHGWWHRQGVKVATEQKWNCLFPELCELRVYQTDLDNRVPQVSRCPPQQIDRLCMLNIVEFRIIVQMSVANNKVTLGWFMPKECKQGLAVSL